MIAFLIDELDMSNYAADNVVLCYYNLYVVSKHSLTMSRGYAIGNLHEYKASSVSTVSSRLLVSTKPMCSSMNKFIYHAANSFRYCCVET